MKKLSNLKNTKTLSKAEQKKIKGSSEVLFDCTNAPDGQICVVITNSWQYNFGICYQGECN